MGANERFVGNLYVSGMENCVSISAASDKIALL
jgi:hypothetical protein